LYLVRQALFKHTEDEEYVDIANAFTNGSFKLLLNMPTIQTEYINDRLTISTWQAGKTFKLTQVVQKYANLFLEEYHHFLKMNGQI
jgi:hypothetical protein